jgi:hypothetical protein
MSIIETIFDGKLKVYNANANLKSIGVSQQFTNDQVVEYAKCMADPIYFIENYCYIVSLDFGLILAKLPDAVKSYVDIIHNNRKVIAMFPRQMYKTTTTAAYILWYTLFDKNKTVAIMANKATTAREILSRYQTMYENLPMWIQQGVLEWNKGSVKLENGSIVFTGATSKSGVRGKSVNLLYVDEAAIINNTIAKEFFTAITPSISAGSSTKLIMTSTPLGYNHFWDYWSAAQNKSNDFIPVRLYWYDIPGKTDSWLEEQRRALGELGFRQEVLCEFLGSSNTLINCGALELLQARTPETSAENIDILYPAQRGNLYVLVADVSKGTGNDFSAFTVIDVTQLPYKVVCKYRDNKIHPRLYPNVIYKIAKYYNTCPVLVEINVGEEVANSLHDDFDYEELITIGRNKRGQIPFVASRRANGIITDKKIKRLGCNSFKNLVESRSLIIEDADIIKEISVFVETNGTWAAQEGSHDDLVITLVLFGWLAETAWFSEYTNSGGISSLYKNQTDELNTILTMFNNNIDIPIATESSVEYGVVWQNPDGSFYNKRDNAPPPVAKNMFLWRSH